MTEPTDRFAAARAIADTVLYEGYVRYPYRATDAENRVRFQWGVLCPPGAEHDGAREGPASRTEMLVRADDRTRVDVLLRHLQLQDRQVLVRMDGDVTTEAVQRVSLEDRDVVSWVEAAEVEHAVPTQRVLALVDRPLQLDFEVAGSEQDEVLDVTAGRIVRVRRTRWPLAFRVLLGAESVAPGVVRLRLDVLNLAPWRGATRDEALRHSLVAAHSLTSVTHGAFVSLLEPPVELAEHAARCRNTRTWPVLVGPRDQDTLVLSSPIILYDRPEVARESPGLFFDATEMDELLALRVMTITDAEKLEARATDPRAAAVVHDVDGSAHLAVTIDDDPGADLHAEYGRYHYFQPEEVEALESASSEGGRPGARGRGDGTP